MTFSFARQNCTFFAFFFRLPCEITACLRIGRKCAIPIRLEPEIRLKCPVNRIFLSGAPDFGTSHPPKNAQKNVFFGGQNRSGEIPEQLSGPWGQILSKNGPWGRFCLSRRQICDDF